MALGETVPAEFQSGGVIECFVLRGYEAMEKQGPDVASSYLTPALLESSRCNALKPYNAPPRFGCLVSALALIGREVTSERQMQVLHSACRELGARVPGDIWLKLPQKCQAAVLGEAICRQLLAEPLDDLRRVASYQDSFCHELLTSLSEYSARRNMAKLTAQESSQKELEAMPDETPSLEELGIEYSGIGCKVREQGFKFLGER